MFGWIGISGNISPNGLKLNTIWHFRQLLMPCFLFSISFFYFQILKQRYTQLLHNTNDFYDFIKNEENAKLVFQDLQQQYDHNLFGEMEEIKIKQQADMISYGMTRDDLRKQWIEIHKLHRQLKLINFEKNYMLHVKKHRHKFHR